MGANQVAFGVAALFLIWYVVGAHYNRRRANALARAISHALAPVGARASIKPVGNSAFQIEVDEPAQGLTGLTLLCLLEPRDFPLAWVWMRLRGHRDRIVLKASFRQAPARPVVLEGQPVQNLGLRRLTVLRLQHRAPHLHLAFAVGIGEEEEIARAFRLVAGLAAGEVHVA